MGNLKGFVSHLIFVCAFLFAATYTCLGVRITIVCSEQERLAVLKFKNSVKDPSGMLSSWVGNDCCLWERIHCDGVTGNVESLHLKGGNSWDVGYNYLVSNEVNSSLADLKHLKYLDLSGNDFRGSRIPEFIGSLKQLTYLNLSNAEFQGIIPHQIGNLSNLEVLDLSLNIGLMAIDMAWTSGFSSLEHLDLGSVDLAGAQNWDMLFYMIPSLKELRLTGCGLSNTDITPSLNLSRILPNIKHLDLSFNYFKGPIPGFFQNVSSSITFLDLSSYNLSLAWNFANFLSTIPSLSELHLSYCGLDKTYLSSLHLNFSTLSSIQHLDLSRNSIEGTFPSVFTNMSSLKVLDLSINMLNSSVPIMPNLLELYLSGNQFQKINDVGIWRQCHLKQLHASHNHFELEMISLPKNESECSEYALEWLDLSNCGLTGPIPKSLNKLRYLEVLDLSNNQLTGSIPTSVSKLVSLKVVSVSSNMLNGTIPVSIGQLSKLHSIYFSNNSFEGVVTDAHFVNLSMLEVLDASLNTKLIFNVSCKWIPPFKLVSLDLSSCNIVNGFPQWLQNQKKLRELVLFNCTISGPLPRWLQKIPVIPYLDFSHNKLYGPLTNLPSGETDSGYGSLLVLRLGNNLFNGLIPRSLCRTDIEYLNLSRNRLTGKIPKCLEKSQGLDSIVLTSNQLSGVIPRFIGLNSLYRLKLNDNNLIGEIPRELGNLRNLVILDLGDNKLSGNIPEWVGEKLTSLVLLRLRKNNFTGRIRHSLCKASNLQILDVAHNNLTGTIPPCLGELNAMGNNSGPGHPGYPFDHDENVDQVMKGVDIEYTTTWIMVFNMDLSSNKFLGEIPVELTALSMLVGLNLSNNHLSGYIPGTIGNMTNLFSLDLSSNELIGVIPPSMAALTFLSHLNLSHNNLSGRIPIGNQLQTLIDPSIYEGNQDLCGPPLPNNCSNHEDPTTRTTNKKKDGATDEKNNVWMFYVDIMSGFATGFWGIIGILLLKEEWKQKLFKFSEEMMEKIYVAVMVRTANIKRGRDVA